jgi:predicted metal-dependent hydrolase
MPRGFDTCLAEGVALFDSGRFFEAHEVWEEAWQHERGPRRLLLQGLILVAAGWLKRDVGNARGARTLFSRALERLEALPPACEGVDVGGLRPQVAGWREGGPCDRPLLARLLHHQAGGP